MRGHGNQENQTESNSNFVQLMKLWGEDDSRIITWLEKKTDKYTSPDMQNEILKTMALQFLIKWLDQFILSPFLSLMVDESTDISNKE